jgi:hydroxymethylpyrimidine pyrophosphatase-like HAD family hydrolase
MRYVALACDYDGTLACQGIVDEACREALARFEESGRKLILVTGRELEDLVAIFPHLDLFAYVVAENGALLYHPPSQTTTLLGNPPPTEFVQALRQRGVMPLAIGRVLVATLRPHANAVKEVIRESQLNLQIIFNKEAVMVLPTGVDKATGLAAALRALEIAPDQVLAIGDAENDETFLHLCGCAVAVANALPTVKATATLVTRGERGAGVVELINQLMDSDVPTKGNRPSS